MATAPPSNNESNKGPATNDSCLQRILQNPFSYIILLIIGFIYSIILVLMEWNSNCYGLSHTFTWKYYLLSSIAIFLIYHIYLIILSRRFCLKLLLKPIFGLIMYTFLGNAILCLIWCIYGFIDWSLLNNKCNNNHIIIGYCTILIIYSIISLILSIQQCFIGIQKYKKRIKHKRYIGNQQITVCSEETINKDNTQRNDTEDQEIPQQIQHDIDNDNNIDADIFTVPDDKLKEFVEEYNYFDGLDFSRSNIYDASTSNVRGASPPNPAGNQSRLQLQSTMPALNELKSHTVRDGDNNNNNNNNNNDNNINRERLEVPPPLSRDNTGNASTSIGAKSFSNLFFGEAREMSSTMFIDYKKDNSDDNLMCMVCLEIFEAHDSIGKLMCHHMFHKQCIYQWLKKNSTCPLCREDVQKFANVPFL